MTLYYQDDQDRLCECVSTTYERGPRVTEQGWRRITLKFIHEHVPA